MENFQPIYIAGSKTVVQKPDDREIRTGVHQVSPAETLPVGTVEAEPRIGRDAAGLSSYRTQPWCCAIVDHCPRQRKDLKDNLVLEAAWPFLTAWTGPVRRREPQACRCRSVSASF